MRIPESMKLIIMEKIFYHVLCFVEEQSWCWQSLDKTVSLPLIPDGGVKKLKQNYDLCVTGEVRYCTIE